MVPVTLFVLGSQIGSAVQCGPVTWRPSPRLAWPTFVVAFTQVGIVALLPKASDPTTILTTVQILFGLFFGVIWYRYVRK
jgi:hypothetical protein